MSQFSSPSSEDAEHFQSTHSLTVPAEQLSSLTHALSVMRQCDQALNHLRFAIHALLNTAVSDPTRYLEHSQNEAFLNQLSAITVSIEKGLSYEAVQAHLQTLLDEHYKDFHQEISQAALQNLITVTLPHLSDQTVEADRHLSQKIFELKERVVRFCEHAQQHPTGPVSASFFLETAPLWQRLSSWFLSKRHLPHSQNTAQRRRVLQHLLQSFHAALTQLDMLSEENMQRYWYLHHILDKAHQQLLSVQTSLYP